MATLCLLFISLCLFMSVNCAVNNDNVPNSFDNHQPEITAVLSHLNSASVKVYNYKEGTLVNAHSKADITELTLDVSVDCINVYPDLPCTEKILVCNAFVRNSPESGSRVLNDVKCVPKPEIIIEEAPYVFSSQQPTADQTNELKTIALSNEAVSSEVGEHFVAVRRDSVPCLGCPFDLNTDAKGVDELINIALKHLETEQPKKQALVKVLRLQQQVVSGVKLILTAEIAPTTCPKEAKQEQCFTDSESESFICEIIFLHKPWISKQKHVIKNNCTTSQEYVIPDPRKNDLNNEIDVNSGRTNPAFVDNPNFDHIAENGAVEDMTSSRLEDLESQILVDSDDVVVLNQPNQVPATAQSGISALENRPLEDKSNLHSTEKAKIERMQSSTVYYVETTTQEESTTSSSLFTSTSSLSEENVMSKRSNSEESSEETISSKPCSEGHLSVEKPKRQKRAIPQLEKISPDEKGLVKNLADFAAASLDSIDDDNHKRIILQILGAKKMVGDDGVYYRLIMRMGISECLEDRPPEPNVNCRERLFENYTKICKVQVFVNDDIASPKVVKSQCQNIKRDKDNNSNRTNYSRFKRNSIPGGQFTIDKDSEKVQELVKQGATHLNSQLNKNYKPEEIFSATSQVVAGSIYRIKAKLSHSDTSPTICEIKVWEKSWENFREYTVKCENGDQLLNYNPNSRKKRSDEKYPTLGGEKDIDKDSEEVKSLFNQGITHLNSQLNKNYKPVEVVSATAQVVAGRLYRINGKVAHSDSSPTVCEIKVWEKSWENFREYTIKCENGDQLLKYNPNSRKKRSNEENQIKGGQKEIDKDSEEVQRLFNQGVTHLNTQLHKNYRPVEVVSATAQVVAGRLYRIKAKVAPSREEPHTVCDIKVWEKLWEDFQEFTVSCENGIKLVKFNPKVRSKRQLGDPSELNSFITQNEEVEKPKEDEFVGINLEEALAHMDIDSGHQNKLKIHKIISVANDGHIYTVKAQVVVSDCKKTANTDRDHCGKLKGSVPRTCDFVFEEHLQVPNVTCEVRRSKRSIDNGHHTQKVHLGGEFDAEEDDEYVIKYLEEALAHMDSESSDENKLKLHKVVKATQQVTAGHIYRISAKVVLSDCKKSESTSRNKCGRLAGAEPKTCNFIVYEQLWIPNSRRFNITCDDDEKQHFFRSKRSVGLLGGDDIHAHFVMFNEFIKKYNKKYNKKEYKYRLKVFSDNMKYVQMLNTYEQGTATYGVTKFADLTQREFSKSLGLRPDLRNENETPFAHAQIPNLELPKEFDWRKKGVVTEVKNQQQCGSCWAFSVTGNVEGQYAIKHGKLMEFSEQELVDCDTEDQGCNGGLMDTAYRQIEKLGGLETEQDYPYDAEDENCHFNRSLARVQLTGALNISHNETDMAKWLVANGPISIAINANAMQFYMGGVSHPFKFLCSPNNLDHGVLIVGYGVHTYALFNKTLPYWIVKNSWGTSWGEQGYYRVYRGDGTCGLNQTPSSAIVA